LSEEDKKLIRKAFDVSVEAHKNNEENQEAYIFHPLLWQK
jgi:GTP pyrophosphokinase